MRTITAIAALTGTLMIPVVGFFNIPAAHADSLTAKEYSFVTEYGASVICRSYQPPHISVSFTRKTSRRNVRREQPGTVGRCMMAPRKREHVTEHDARYRQRPAHPVRTMKVHMVVGYTKNRGVFTAWLREPGVDRRRDVIATRPGRPDCTPGRHRRRW